MSKAADSSGTQSDELNIAWRGARFGAWIWETSWWCHPQLECAHTHTCTHTHMHTHMHTRARTWAVEDPLPDQTPAAEPLSPRQGLEVENNRLLGVLRAAAQWATETELMAAVRKEQLGGSGSQRWRVCVSDCLSWVPPCCH